MYPLSIQRDIASASNRSRVAVLVVLVGNSAKEGGGELPSG